MNKKEVAINLMTMENLRNKPNNSNNVFVYYQNGVKYKINKNSMLRMFQNHGNNMKNPFTRQPMPANAIKRLNNILSSQNKKLTNEEKNFLNGVHEFSVAFNYILNNNGLKLRKLSNMYIEDLSELLNNNEMNNLKRIKNSLIKKGRL
jgi:hypothetical protein